uniref:Uncharacterized protein n=1 Tax=Anopheles quadriannulatus TaxID=34691 RepID=A0A182XRJ8_ANOQN
MQRASAHNLVPLLAGVGFDTILRPYSETVQCSLSRNNAPTRVPEWCCDPLVRLV